MPPRPASEVTSGRLLRNTLLNGVANVTGAAVTLLLTPFLLRRLGAEQYGIWLLALSLTFSSGYLALADLGLPEAAVRFIAEARAIGSVDTINEIASTATCIFAIAGIVGGALIALLSPLLVRLFDITGRLSGPAHVVFLLMGLEVAIDLPAAGLLAVIEGAQRYSWLRAIDIGGRVVWAILVVAVVVDHHGVEALAITSVAITAVGAVASFFAAHRCQPGLRIRPRLVKRATLRRTSSYGSVLAGLRVLSILYTQMDRVIIGIALATAAVASYEVAFRIQSVTTLALAVGSSAVLPAAAYNSARGDTDKQRELFLRGTKYAIALVLPVSLAAFIYARPLIVAWVGPRYAFMAGAARLFLIFPVCGSVYHVGVQMLIGLGQVRRVFFLQLISVIVNLVLSIVLVTRLGISGVIWGTVIGGTLVWLPYVKLLLSTFDVDLSAWFRRIVLPNIPGAAVQVIVGLLTLHWVEQFHQFWELLLVCGASCLVSGLVFGAFGLDREERRHVVTRAWMG